MTGILIVNKPEGWTSHDIVAKLRRILGERRIGHGGTLDPMATGVLPVFVGRATRAVEFMENADKEYIAALRLGISTDTQDTTGNILSEKPADISREALQAVIEPFRGEIEQLPPMYSAIKVDGKKLYEYARNGAEIERKTRRITIHELEIIGQREDGDYLLRVVCSKGTYIRALCADIGDALGCGGAMSGLVRSRAGAYRLEEAHSMEDIIAAGTEEAPKLLLSLESMFTMYPAVTANAANEKRCRNGLAPRLSNAPDGRFRLMSESGEFLALCANTGEVRVIKSFYEV
ncbi:MAG: tRNA pseudouridine(55) synthase TruB [Clostridiales bacterium]|nr:tRNA pseudouridine(55) synthase TruB [Clostridiales bacterium]